jgi:hypothetical protein
MNAMALVGMSARAGELSDQDRERTVEVIAGESAVAVLPYTEGRGLSFELGSNIATARR